MHSEFDSSSKLFVNSFPTLFPGGVGDIYDEKRGETDNTWWARHLLKYYDGRFERHKMFALYAYNMLLRKENSKSSGFFLKKILGSNPSTVEDNPVSYTHLTLPTSV